MPESGTGSRVFSALGDEQRQRMLLMFERDEELTIKDIFEACHSRELRSRIICRCAAGSNITNKRGKVFLEAQSQHRSRSA